MLLLAAVSLAWFALDMMLNRPESLTSKSSRVEKSCETQSKPAASYARKIGHPGVSINRQAATEAVRPIIRASNSAGFKTSPEENLPKITNFSGIALDEIEMIDMREIEERTMEGQFAESLRNPAYLLGISFEDPGQTILDEVHMPNEGTEDDLPIEMLDETDIGYDEIEEEPPSQSEDSFAESGGSQADEDKLGDRANMTEAGVGVNFETVDFNEVEERILSAQLRESQRNPAYLQTSAEESDSE